jgi:hypothetical protein
VSLSTKYPRTQDFCRNVCLFVYYLLNSNNINIDTIFGLDCRLVAVKDVGEGNILT